MFSSEKLQANFHSFILQKNQYTKYTQKLAKVCHGGFPEQNIANFLADFSVK